MLDVDNLVIRTSIDKESGAVHIREIALKNFKEGTYRPLQVNFSLGPDNGCECTYEEWNNRHLRSLSNEEEKEIHEKKD